MKQPEDNRTLELPLVARPVLRLVGGVSSFNKTGYEAAQKSLLGQGRASRYQLLRKASELLVDPLGLTGVRGLTINQADTPPQIAHRHQVNLAALRLPLNLRVHRHLSLVKSASVSGEAK